MTGNSDDLDEDQLALIAKLVAIAKSNPAKPLIPPDTVCPVEPLGVIAGPPATSPYQSDEEDDEDEEADEMVGGDAE
jgi:hypothetical protein